MNKLLLSAIWVTILIALGGMLIVIFWLTYPYKIADFYNKPFPILNENKIVKVGTRARYLMKYCKYTDVMPDLRKFLVNDVVFEISESVGVATKGCHETTTDVYISKNLPLGKFYLRTVAEYKVNPVRTISIVNYTEEFEVVE
jgi:hypothetical protein